jgi:hypothetical protein
MRWYLHGVHIGLHFLPSFQARSDRQIAQKGLKDHPQKTQSEHFFGGDVQTSSPGAKVQIVRLTIALDAGSCG